MIVLQLKTAPLFRAVSSTLSEILLTSIMHKNRYNLAWKRTSFSCIRYTFSNTTLFQPNQEQWDHSFTSIFHGSLNLYPFFQISSTRSGNRPPLFKYRKHKMFANILLKRLLFSWNLEQSWLHKVKEGDNTGVATVVLRYTYSSCSIWVPKITGDHASIWIWWGTFLYKEKSNKKQSTTEVIILSNFLVSSFD